jgi:hypothetical protein
MSEGLTGDPFHEGSSKPLMHLQGSMDVVHTQAPMASENAGSTDGNTITPNVAGWSSTSLAPSAGSTSSSDSRQPR